MAGRMHLKWWWLDRRVYEYFATNVGPLLGWRDPVLVYQWGKVGSSAVRNALFRCDDPRTRLVLMSHEFFPVRTRDPSRLDVAPELRGWVAAEVDHDRRVYESFPLRKRLGWRMREKFYTEKIYLNYVRHGRARIIAPVREPVASNLSMFFQILDHYLGPRELETGLTTDELATAFLERYMHSRPITWFDAEFKPTTGVDVFAHPFSPERGYAVIEQGGIRVLLLRAELDDEAKETAIGEFLGIDGFRMVRSNVSGDKSYAEAYAGVKERIRLPDELLDRMYESRYARHFYSEAERLALRERWGGERHEPLPRRARA